MWLLRIGSDRYTRTLSVVALFVLVLGLVAPTTAWASEGEEEHTGFIAGLETLVNPDSVSVVENDPVRDYEYEPVLRDDVPVRIDEEEPTMMGSIGSVVNGASYVQVDNVNLSLLNAVRWVVGANAGVGRSVLIVASVGLVFMWWGVRKVIRIIKAAWYKGHASV